MINGSQFIFLLPLRILPFSEPRKLYYAGIRYTKGAFGCLQILMCQWFAPTKFRITFETQGLGSFTPEDINRYVIRDTHGEVIALDLPTKFVLIANHQIYADWWYAWCLTYFLSPHGIHRYVYITLKKSLRWVPILGWGMQFFNFIFLARSWASDRIYLVKQLALLGQRAQLRDTPLTFILYPEGTLVSQDTRPISKKYADKLGIPDVTHTILPRSTGLHYSLRALLSSVPSLQLLDITVAYPGIPPMGYGQSYYTLRSIFFDGIPPPAIHMHIRRFDVAADVPIGNISGGMSRTLPRGEVPDVDVPENERQAFDVWLRDRWIEKDKFIQRFHDTGTFSSSLDKYPEIDVPLELRRKREVFGIFLFVIPALGYVWSRLQGSAP